MPDRLPTWLAAADPAAAGSLDADLVAAATAHATGLVGVDPDGTVRWTDEAYRLHGRPRWRRVRTVDDVTHGLSVADAGRVTAAYLELVGSGEVELLYTVTGETGQPHDVLLRGAWPGLALVQRAPYQRAAADRAATAAPEPEAVVELEPEVAHLPEPTHAGGPDPDTDQAFRALFDASPSGLAELRGDGTFVRVNEAFCRLVGRTWDSLRDTVFEALVHHEDRASAFVARNRRDDAGDVVAPPEYRLLHSDGSAVWVRARTSPIASADADRLLVSLENVTTSRALEDQLRHDALHDSMTGLPNRRLVLDRLERAVSRARRGGQRLAVFFIDVDDLKHVNDTHPWQHRAGDVLLTSIAGSLRLALRDTDTLGRLAGDEFLVICEEVGDDVAVNDLCERLLEAARQPVPLGPQTVTPSVSIGLALTGDDDETAEEVLARADSAMYVAKSHGGGRVERADTVAATTTPDLVGALARGELRMHYQPVVSLATGSVLGVAAVLRWIHPSLGMLPAHQVRTALDSASVLPVVDWCIDRAVNDVRTVAPTRVDHVSVWLPVPGRALAASSTRDALRTALVGADGSQNADTAPSLVLDVHESDLATLARRPALRRQLEALTETGPVALGVEHLSADVLPIGALQLLGAASATIDPELLLAASENEPSETLVRSLVTGATALGVVTVATGISSPELLAEARRLGVHAVCGDLVGPAVSLEIYSDLLHGERITLPDLPELSELPDEVEIDDDERYSPAARPVLAAIRALEDDDEGHDAGDDDPAPLDEQPADRDATPVGDQPADRDATAPPGDDDASRDPGGDLQGHVDDARVDDPVDLTDGADAPVDEESGEGAPEPAPEHAMASAAPARLLLGDVIDLAEQVARELGVPLPADPSAAEAAGAATRDEAPDLVDDSPVFGQTLRQLPGLADLHAALESPEVSRALDDRTEPARSEPDGAERGGAIDDEATPPEPTAHAADGITDVTDASLARDVDLRTPSLAVPSILLGPARSDASGSMTVVPPTLHLHGRGGSDGGSIL